VLQAKAKIALERIVALLTSRQVRS
jgi:hypothetical protein